MAVASPSKSQRPAVASNTLGLFFQEQGVGKPWNSNEVSDGTLQTLAMLVAIEDPKFSALAIEEPENSVPWIIRNVITACQSVVPKKQIILTSHSPILMEAVDTDKITHKGAARSDGSTIRTVKNYGLICRILRSRWLSKLTKLRMSWTHSSIQMSMIVPACRTNMCATVYAINQLAYAISQFES